METKTPTPRQKKAAKAVIDNMLLDTPKSNGEVLKSVGYGTGLQNQPARVLQSEGFKAALAEYGLTEELITTSLVEDIKAKPAMRVKELGLGAEILGMKKREEQPEANKGGNTYNFLFNAETQADIKKLEDTIKARLLNHD